MVYLPGSLLHDHAMKS